MVFGGMFSPKYSRLTPSSKQQQTSEMDKRSRWCDHNKVPAENPPKHSWRTPPGNGKKRSNWKWEEVFVCSSSESISLKSHRNITTQTCIAYTPGQTSTSCKKIVWISLKRIYGEYLFPLKKYFCYFHYLALMNMYLFFCRLDLWKYELQCRLQLICLTGTYVFKQVKKESLHFYLCSFFLKSDNH